MSLHELLTFAFAFLTFIVAPIALVATFIHGMRAEASDRKRPKITVEIGPPTLLRWIACECAKVRSHTVR
jgi:hypothetical protein